MIRYINTRSNKIVETVDELDSNDFESTRQFNAEVRRLVKEYQIAFNSPVYSSQRCTKEWAELADRVAF